MLGSVDMQIYGDPCVARKGKSFSPIYRAFSCEVKKFLNPKLQCISTTERRMSMPLSFFVRGMNGQTRVISEMKKCEASTQLWKLKYFQSSNISSFWSLPVVNTCLIFGWQKVGKKIETVAWTHCFRRSVFSYRINITKSCNVYFASYGGQRIMILIVVLALFKRNNRLWPVNFENGKLWNYREEFCALHVSANRLWKCLLSEALCGLVKKIRTPVLFVTNHPFKRQKYSFLDRQTVYQSFCSTPLTFRTFSLEKFCVSAGVGKSLVKCLWSAALR